MIKIGELLSLAQKESLKKSAKYVKEDSEFGPLADQTKQESYQRGFEDGAYFLTETLDLSKAKYKKEVEPEKPEVKHDKPTNITPTARN